MPDPVSPSSLVTEIVRTFRAATMYPVGHPERKRFFHRLIAKISAYQEHRSFLEIWIERGAVRVDDQLVETGDGSGELLAKECFFRQIATVRFHQGVSEADLDQFFLLLAMEPEAVREAGGALEVIRQNASGAVQVDEVDYVGILEKRVEAPSEDGSKYVTRIGAPMAVPNSLIEEGSKVPSFTGSEEREISQKEWLDGKLQELDEAQTEEQYRSILKDIMDSLKTTESMKLPEYGVHVLKHLGRHFINGSPARNPIVLRDAVHNLAKLEAVEELAEQLTVKDNPQRENIQAVFDEVKEISIPVLLQRLADEQEAYGRGAILNALERYGESIRPHLEKWLEDDRWYVVRNAISLLRQVGGSRDSTSIRSFLDHPNSKVRLEALRFLYQHPVHVSEERMVRLLSDEDPEVQARAVYALGVLSGPSGLKRLKSLARKPFLGEGDDAMREMAIKGIGRKGGQDALSFLERLLKKRSFIGLAKGEKIRKAVINALVEMGDPVAAKTVRKVLPRLKGEAHKAAEDFLRRQEEKREEDKSSED